MQNERSAHLRGAYQRHHAAAEAAQPLHLMTLSECGANCPDTSGSLLRTTRAESRCYRRAALRDVVAQRVLPSEGVLLFGKCR